MLIRWTFYVKTMHHFSRYMFFLLKSMVFILLLHVSIYLSLLIRHKMTVALDNRSISRELLLLNPDIYYSSVSIICHNFF
jgi:hypothetical protein